MNHKASEGVPRATSARQRKTQEPNRVKAGIEAHGKRTGEAFDFVQYSYPKWRPHSPEKWMDPKNDGRIPTSQTLLRNLKDKVEKREAQKYFKGNGSMAALKRPSPYVDGVDFTLLKNEPLKDMTATATTQVFEPDPKRPPINITIQNKGEIFDTTMKRALVPGERWPTAASKPSCIQQIETGAAHKSIRTLRNIENQLSIKGAPASRADPESADSVMKKSILKASAKSNLDLSRGAAGFRVELRRS